MIGNGVRKENRWDEVNGFHARLLSSLSWPGLTVHTHPFLASLVDKEA